MKRGGVLFAAACTTIVVVVVLGVRWFGPHDLYEKDQPKTMAYTADVVLHGRFSLPRDVIYQPATKPPMYNWIDAAFVYASGDWGEWTLKLPSVLGVLATGGIVFAMAKRSARNDAIVIGLIAAGVWFTFGSDVRHGSVLRLSYLARPDMLLTAFCTGAWAAFTIALDRPTAKAARGPAALAWACVTAAALTKGPAAALPVVYAIVAVLLPSANATRTRRFNRLWLPVGLPLMLACVGLWLFFAARQDAGHVRTVIWGAELAHRLYETPEGFRKPFYYTVMWFLTKAQPWGAVALLAAAAIAWLPRLRPAAGPAALYLAIVLVGLSLPAAKRMDYLLPAYAPAAVLIAAVGADVVRRRVLTAAGVLAAVGLVALLAVTGDRRPVDWAAAGGVVIAVVVCSRVERRRAVPLAVLAVVPLALGLSQAETFRTKFFEAKERWSDHAVAFVRDVRRHVRDDQRLYVLVRGKHPLTTLLGRHPGSYLTPALLRSAAFVILPEQPDLKAEVLSAPLPEGLRGIGEPPAGPARLVPRRAARPADQGPDRVRRMDEGREPVPRAGDGLSGEVKGIREHLGPAGFSSPGTAGRG